MNDLVSRIIGFYLLYNFLNQKNIKNMDSIFYFTIYQEKTVKETLINFFPVFLRNYWFVTVYIVLLILSPFLNKLINSLSQKQYMYLIEEIMNTK